MHSASTVLGLLVPALALTATFAASRHRKVTGKATPLLISETLLAMLVAIAVIFLTLEILLRSLSTTSGVFFVRLSRDRSLHFLAALLLGAALGPLYSARQEMASSKLLSRWVGSVGVAQATALVAALMVTGLLYLAVDAYVEIGNGSVRYSAFWSLDSREVAMADIADVCVHHMRRAPNGRETAKEWLELGLRSGERVDMFYLLDEKHTEFLKALEVSMSGTLPIRECR